MTNQTLAPSAAPQATPAAQAIPPEQTLLEMQQLFEEPDDERFRHEAVAFAMRITSSRAGMLYVLDNDRPVPKVVTSTDGSATAASAQQQVDQVANNALRQQTSQRATITLQQGKFALLCVPILAPDQMPQALALLLGPERAPFLGPAFTVLHLTTQVFVRRAMDRGTQGLREGFYQATMLIDLFSRASKAGDFREAIAIVSDEIQELIGCSRVAIGVGDRFRCKVEGVSGAGHLENSSQATGVMATAMREAIGVEAPVVWPERSDIPHLLTAASQERLLDAMGAKEVVTVPLRMEGPEGPEGAAVGAWCFIWSGDRALDTRQLELIQAATPHAAALVKMIKRSQPRGVRGAIHRFLVRATPVRRALLIAVPVLILATLLFPIPYKIGAPCELQPQRTRQVAAPFEGVLETALVKPGDAVEEGELLAVLDGKETNWRLAEAIARREGALKRRDQAMADKDVSETQLAQFESDSLGLQVELLKYQKDNLEIRAPISGLVLSGNLERSEGVPVQTGQKLFDIAPIETLELEIAIPDSEVLRVDPGMKVNFRLESQARYSHETELEEVYPISELQDDANVFVGLAKVENESGELRPGMRGRAKIVSDRKPIGWILFHRLWDYLRLRFW